MAGDEDQWTTCPEPSCRRQWFITAEQIRNYKWSRDFLFKQRMTPSTAWNTCPECAEKVRRGEMRSVAYLPNPFPSPRRRFPEPTLEDIREGERLTREMSDWWKADRERARNYTPFDPTRDHDID